ncbi:MAG: diguanylate cyclase, partial [Desulfobacteraceae bacterium]|nr:diguanylate cyclase [Desulfobacteraceae bacterium]
LKNPDITTVTGEVYTKKNPALMTREISKLAEQAGDFQYHITSLKPLNPNNGPDEFERRALNELKFVGQEVFSTFSENGKTDFRYMAPLFVEEGCLACHGKQGYKKGDVRGGISVTFDVSKIKQDMFKNNALLTSVSVVASVLLLIVIYYMVTRLAGKLFRAYKLIEELSVLDDLTKIYNRRYFFTRLKEEIERAQRFDLSLSLLFMDIDFFKKVNDTHGHLAGDHVLVAIANLIKQNLRRIDVVARYGGEEIAVILPETGSDNALIAAEKIRKVIENHAFDIGDSKKIKITASFGISSLDMVASKLSRNPEELVKLADEALYIVKENGRNKSMVAKA